MTIETMLNRLRAVRPNLPPNLPDSMRYASVLCLLYPSEVKSPSTPASDRSHAETKGTENDNDLNVILTLRSSSMRSHAGDVSFPGGRRDETDGSNWVTALREANEEINLPYELSAEGSGTFQKICEFPPYLSKNNLLVTPCIAYSPIDPYKCGWDPKRSEDEVEEIFAIRLSDIRDAVGYEGRWMTWYSLSWRMHQFFLAGLAYPFSTSDKKRIWGLTARMLVDISRTAFDVVPTYEFVDELGDQSRILKALKDGVFGEQGRQEKERAETTGEGQIQGETDQANSDGKRRRIVRRGVI